MSSDKQMLLYNVTFSYIYLCLRQCEIYFKKVFKLWLQLTSCFCVLCKVQWQNKIIEQNHQLINHMA